MIEKIQPLSDSAKLPSNRSFGLLFTVVFLIVAAYTWTKDYSAQWVQIWLVISGVFLAFALLFPAVLTPLNKMWFALGLLLGKVVSPVVLGILFYCDYPCSNWNAFIWARCLVNEKAFGQLVLD